jgi:histidine phosphotransfer protein HptB
MPSATDAQKGHWQMVDQKHAVVDWARFAQSRTQLGPRFLRVINYFREDGGKSIAAIEASLRVRNPIGMIGPADLLKNDALQIGALSVAEIAEDIEFAARDCVEWRQAPDALLESVMALKAHFAETLTLLDREVNPLLAKRAG